MKSSSGVQDVLLTRSLVFPAIISSACLHVSGNLHRNAFRASGFEIGWNIAAGRSCNVNIGDRILYGLFFNCFAIAFVTVNDAVGAYLPNTAS